MTPIEWGFLILAVIIFGGPAAHLIRGALTGTKPSPAEQAGAEGFGSRSPAHPAGKAIPREPEPFDAELWEQRYAAAQDPQRRGQR